jgi:hypothetical protein
VKLAPVFLLATLALAGCGSRNIPLPEVAEDAPRWRLNGDQWEKITNEYTRTNDYIHPPSVDGTETPITAPIQLGKYWEPAP